MIPWLGRDRPNQPLTPFPPLSTALRDPNGLLCAGGGLSVERLLAAYRRGIFPWFSAGEPLLWWSPDPRMVLFPAEFKPSRSLRRELKKPYRIRLDHDFSAVIHACAHTPRRDQNGTWIVDKMKQAYLRLHERGWAHSVEVWEEDAATQTLIGGLYGVAIGRMFFGESMFTRKSNASKIAIAHLIRYLETHEFGMIDCQMHTPHLASLGAREIPRDEFIARLETLCAAPVMPGLWRDE
ncbi:MAG: leucyl/phenylalanyl-tRNA--protein transferase [Azoarcus sp.]|jgi:leucyl/phenylalanyl-tRNA--protein transferase|nr:leucyl/phenylalanyl-tRNA--protein transferase [Azoarcus sp.]